VAQAPWTVSSLDVRRDLHWLPVSYCATFKLWSTTWKTFHTAHPPYLPELIIHCIPSRALHSFNINLQARPSGITSNFTSRAFSVSAPSTWNSLPTHIRSVDKLSTFKRLKSHLFQSAFALVTLCQRLRFASRFWRYINVYVLYVCATILLGPFNCA